MKISSLQELVNWLLDLDPNGSICWPCILPHFEICLYKDPDSEEAAAIRKIQAVGNSGEEPEATFKRCLSQFILTDLSISPDAFRGKYPLCLQGSNSLVFSGKAFTHWMIAELEKITGDTVALDARWRKAVDGYKNIYR